MLAIWLAGSFADVIGFALFEEGGHGFLVVLRQADDGLIVLLRAEAGLQRVVAVGHGRLGQRERQRRHRGKALAGLEAGFQCLALLHNLMNDAMALGLLGSKRPP